MESMYFVDFDYTITNEDVWDSLVRRSAPDEWEECIRMYLSGELSSRLCNKRLAESVRMTEPEAREMILAIGVDPAFHDFVKWAEGRDSRLIIVSDGYDYYIRLILEREGLGRLEWHCNRLQWIGGGIRAEFPLLNPECEQDMAHCKCQHVLKREGMTRVYIGDGMSDICAARRCEVIYAKRNLLDYCENKGLPHTPFDSFRDVIEGEERRLNGGG